MNFHIFVCCTLFWFAKGDAKDVSVWICAMCRGCRFQEGNRLKLDYDVPTGLAKALQTWATWLENHLDTKKSEVFWLSFPTVHFR